jgi:hypothetical protein
VELFAAVAQVNERLCFEAGFLHLPGSKKLRVKEAEKTQVPEDKGQLWDGFGLQKVKRPF